MPCETLAASLMGDVGADGLLARSGRDCAILPASVQCLSLCVSGGPCACERVWFCLVCYSCVSVCSWQAVAEDRDGLHSLEALRVTRMAPAQVPPVPRGCHMIAE